MRSSILALAAVAGLVSAQFPGVPDCAQDCLTSAISQVKCPITDVGCQCSSTAEIQGYGAGCILKACTAPGDLNSAIQGGQGLCKAYLATVSATATGSSSEELTTTLASTVTQTSTVTAETTSVPVPTTQAPVYGGSNSTGPAATGTGAPPTTSAAGVPPPPPSQVPVAGASTLAVGFGGVAALVIGLFAVAL